MPWFRNANTNITKIEGKKEEMKNRKQKLTGSVEIVGL